ncbi:GDSL-type esterase/lipase family protein [Clostridium sp.]|uniref:SGNH/GDSL hydrolase family protein n=1 Tax=Clostridium sp. TaxID=1506 RepID=UPI001B71587A|nr:GDSL-type esterase/lipase family protein [Clostridium sp.]MBP3916361.1 hypothetical protein [Clostridium sp.]
MGLDNKLIFPDFQTLTLDKDNPTVYYTREASGEIYRIDGRSEVKQETTWKKGFMVSADGYVQNSANTALEGAINISNFTTPLTIRLGNTIPTYNTVVFLNSEKLHISTVNYADLNALEIPSGAKYLKLSYNHAVHSGMKEPEVYINDVLVYGINEVANVGLLNVSTNKYDINITSSKDYTLGLINEGDYDVYVDTKYNNYFIKNIPVVPNSKITIAKGSARNIQFTIYKYDANRVEGYGAVIEQIYGNVDIQTISIPSNCESITLLIRDTTEHPTGLYLQEGDKFVDYVQTSTKTISIEQPLRQANNNVYDSIYRFGDGGYYLFKRVGVRPYQDGDYDNPLVITDGVNTNYDLGIADYTEVQLTDFDPSIDFFGTDTTFSCDSMMPSIEVKVPIDYAYNESKRKYRDEEIIIDEVDIDDRKDIDILSIEGQTFENLLQEPLDNVEVTIKVDLEGRELNYTDGENIGVPLREIQGDTYINLLEDKIGNTTIKPIASYISDMVDGQTQFMKLENDMLEDGILNGNTGLEETSQYNYKRTKFIKIFSNGKQLEIRGYNQNSPTASNISFFFYDENKNYIGRTSSNGQKIHKINIPVNTKYFRMQSDYFNGGAINPDGNIKYEMFIPFDYNLGDYDKVTIDEIKGNTKVYNDPIPVADYKTNAFCCDLVLQSIDNAGKQDLNKKESLGSSNYIYVKDFNKGIYARVYEKGSIVSKGFGATWHRYDDNLKYIGKSGWAIDDSARPMNIPDTSYIKLVLTNNNEAVEHQEGIYDVVISDTMPTGYIEPTILGSKTFPIQSVGNSILDEDGTQQYKIDINSINSRLDKSNILSYTIGNGTLVSINEKGNYVASQNNRWNSVKFQFNLVPIKEFATDYEVNNAQINLYLYFKLRAKKASKAENARIRLIYPSYNNGEANTDIEFTEDEKIIEKYIKFSMLKTVIADDKFSNFGFTLNTGDTTEYATKEIELLELSIGYAPLEEAGFKRSTESILLPQPLRGISDRCDSLVWNSQTSKYEIIPRVKKLILDDSYIYGTNWAGATDKYAVFILNLARVPDLARPNDIGLKNIICDKLPSYDQSLFGNLEANGICITNHPAIYIKVNIEEFGLSSNNDVEGFKTWLRNNGGLEVYYQTTDNTAIETNITKPITIPCYDNTTAIYTGWISSHDNVNNPYLEQLKGEITCTTLPLSTTAYIKPSTKYTMFMDTDCQVSYNLGGMEKEYKPTNGLKNNIMKKEYWLDNTTIDGNTGEASSNSLMMGTDFIPVIPNDTLNFNHVTLNRYIQVYGYGKDKEFIKNLWNGSTSFKLTVPSDVYYIRFYGAKDNNNIGMTSENIIVKSEKEYSTQGKLLITTPSTLSNNTLTLLGEGNIGNVTLLEGDYTNSYVPDTCINDVFSVGELQEDGSYKVDIVSKNKNLAVIKNIDFPYTTVPTIVKNDEEKSIELRSSSGRDLLTKTNLNFKAGITYTLSIKIETNNTNTSARIILIDDINKQNSIGNNATTVVSINNPATTKTITTTFTPNVDSCLFLNLNNYSNLASETYMKFSEIIVLEGNFNEQDINCYEGKYEVKSISLPQPLRRVGDVCDRFYWDDTRRKMCIEKNVAEIDFSNFDFSPCPYVSGRFQITVPNMITGEGALICNSIKAYGVNHGDLHGDTTDSNGYIVGAVAVGSDKYIILRLGKGMTKDDTIQWLINHNTKIYHRVFPEIIETDITEPIEIDIFDTDTTITATSTVKPNFHLKSFSVTTVPVNIKPSTKYYVFADVTGITTINLGGSEIRYNTNDSYLEITTPSVINENTISFIGDYNVSDVMLRTDNRLDINYFFGKVYASTELEDGNYETTITATPMNGEEPTIVKIITSSPLKANTSITRIGDGYKYINELGEEEDVIINGIIPTSNSFNSFRAEGIVPAITNVIISYRSIRPLKTPVNLAFNNYTDNDSHTFTWTTDVGVEGHKFYYKDELVATIDSPDPTYTYPSEMEGDVKIVAFNTLTESEGAIENIVTLPNRSEVVALNTIYDNGYKFTIDFNDNSNIRKGYKFIYSVDDGEENIIDIPVSDKAITLSQNIDVSEVSNNMKVRINSYNSVGEAEMKEKIFYLTPTPKWAYLLSSDNLMFRHQDKFPFTTYYKIKATNTQTLEENEYSYGSNQGINGLIIDYLLKSNREEELSVMLTMNDGYLDHIPCVPFKVSKTLDLSLVAPQNFTMEWVGDGIAKFSWDDNYTNEDYFEFVYSLNGGIEEVVKIYPDDVVGTGGRVSYTYKFDGFGILTGRVRMVWELNTSEYTDSKTATFVAVTGLPPAWIVKEYSGDNLVITWEAQSYVDHYEIMIECDGEVEILTEKKDMFYLDLGRYHGKYVSISIKTHFTTGLVTEYSDSILFKPVSTSGITNQMTYAPIKVEKDDNVSVYTKLADGYTSYQRITGLITNSNLLYNKFCKDMLTNSASFNNVFYHLVNHEYKDFVSVKTDNVSIESLIRILNYAHINQDGHLNTFVYTPITSSHTDFVDIQKVTIVCIGDSITAGHPHFWAESMTGDIESQYPYWLSKRLNNVYDVINKGFGSDRTYNVLARFKADVLDLNPQYCIIQAGTND